MRLDNYIFDHPMKLPDIADFPECTGNRFPSDVNIEPILNSFTSSMTRLCHESFAATLQELLSIMDAHVHVEEEALRIRAEQVYRILSFTDVFMTSTRNQVSRDDLPENDVYKAMRDDGVYATTFDTRKITALLEKEIKELLEIDDHDANPHNYDRARQYTPETNQELFQIVGGMFRDHGVLSGASRYNQGKDLNLVSIALQIASPSDTHHYQTLRDCETVTKLISLHADPKFNLMKSIFYLSDVDDESGPFSYVKQSNRWWFDETERLFAYGNSTGNYLDSPAARHAALAFPARLRKNAIVGRFIPDGSELSDTLLSTITRFTSDQANCMVFDPLGFHRGGLCHSKCRVCLQILMR